MAKKSNGEFATKLLIKEKNSNLVHKLAHNVHFGHELANREF
jgi:hypothetical protein